jgi:hypothetical protein
MLGQMPPWVDDELLAMWLVLLACAFILIGW